MSYARYLLAVGLFALLTTVGNFAAGAQEIKTVFVIALENHNWTQPANQFTGGIQQIFENPNAPFINSLVNGTAYAVINGSTVHISGQVAYATAYHNVLATLSGNNPHIHPSEPNYLWAEAGTNFGVLNDNDPYLVSGGTNQNTTQHLSSFLTQAGKTWRWEDGSTPASPPSPLALRSAWPSLATTLALATAFRKPPPSLTRSVIRMAPGLTP